MARKSKYENQSKVICGLEYSSHEYRNKKLRVTVIIDGIKYQHYVCTQTWKNAKDSIQSTFNKLSWRFKKFFKKIEEKTNSYLPVIYNPIRKDFLGTTDEESFNWILDKLERCESSKELRKTYKQMIKNYHPDILKRELFPHEQIIFNEIKRYKDIMMEFIKEIEETFGMKLD